MEEGQLENHIHSMLKEARTAPFLFVGTGLSIRYLRSGNWEELLRHFADETDRSFGYYNAKAKRSAVNGGKGEVFPRIGSLIDKSFFEVWYDKNKYAPQRERLRAEGNLPSSPLKYEIAATMQQLVDTPFPEEHEEEIALLKDATVDGIITTNYDRLLQRLFNGYDEYVGQDEVIFAEQHSIAEIYQIHGSCTDPSSLVLTHEDYKSFDARNEYLTAKLITTFLEHPVIFLGYSIEDPNIRTILRSVVNCLDEERLNKLKDRILFVEWNRAPESPYVTTREIGLQGSEKGPLAVTRVSAHSFEPIFAALAKGKRRMSARLMRRMKKQMYEFVHTNEPQSQIHVVDIEEAESHDDVEFVMGVGVRRKLAERGATGIHVDELFRDLVTHGHEFDDISELIVSRTLREWLQPGWSHTPVYKYLQIADFLDEDRFPRTREVPGKVAEVAKLPISNFVYQGVSSSTRDEYVDRTVEQVVKEKERHQAARYITFIDDPSQEEIASFLRANVDMLNQENEKTPFKKLACLYDRMKYGPGLSALDDS